MAITQLEADPSRRFGQVPSGKTQAKNFFNNFFSKILFVHERERERTREQRGGAAGEGEAVSWLSTEPNAGLNAGFNVVFDPRTPGL